MEQNKQVKETYATHTTLRAFALKKGYSLTEDQFKEFGNAAADTHYTIFACRPRKIEVIENGVVVKAGFYNKRFEKILLNLIKKYK